MQTRIRGRMIRTAAVALVVGSGVLMTAGCNNAGQGAVTGAALGSLVGMGLGSLNGDMGKGAAAGALIGGLGGLIIGDQNARNDTRYFD